MKDGQLTASTCGDIGVLVLVVTRRCKRSFASQWQLDLSLGWHEVTSDCKQHRKWVSFLLNKSERTQNVNLFTFFQGGFTGLGPSSDPKGRGLNRDHKKRTGASRPLRWGNPLMDWWLRWNKNSLRPSRRNSWCSFRSFLDFYRFFEKFLKDGIPRKSPKNHWTTGILGVWISKIWWKVLRMMEFFTILAKRTA